MTDNHTDAKSLQHQSSATNQAKDTENNTNSQRTQAQKVNPSSLTADRTVANVNKKLVKAPEPQMKKVDIVIAGITYPIFCPVNEEEELRSAVYDINNFMLDLKKDAPNLAQENLLVLCCLNLHEKISTNKKSDTSRLYEGKQTAALLSKIRNDAQSIL